MKIIKIYKKRINKEGKINLKKSSLFFDFVINIYIKKMPESI